MRLAREDELHRPLGIAQDAQQPVGIVQQKIGPLVSREAARKAEGQHVRIEDDAWAASIVLRGRLRRPPAAGRDVRGHIPPVTCWLAVRISQSCRRRPCGYSASTVRRSQPSLLAAGIRPEIVGGRRIPSRHVHAVGDVTDRHLVLRPSRERAAQRCCRLTSPCKSADAVDRPAPAHREVGHVERLRRVVGIPASQRQQLVHRNAQFVLGVPAEILLDQGRRKAVKARGDGGVGGEEIAGARGRQRHVERLPGLFHETPGALQHGEGCMAFIEMADVRLDSERARAIASRRCRAPSPASDAIPARRRRVRW